ncbi:aldo/keto reductase [Megasphaera sp. D52t1_170925_H4]|uniref:aldo/keto reductase n=1 Tax=Megasphaera sp. D52t1_170925_H4 TaxID=2787095 RepID=UPI001898365E|nr:aldo/keto reductase [Megasphaera sp. D52t1_170925_H4]
MEFVTLNNGIKMPKLGYGVYQTAPNDTERAVSDALEIGYRLIDTAAAYDNEQGVGAAIRQSGLPREDLFVTTKLWVQDHGYDNTLRAFDTSMKKLGLDYLDLYLIHKPYGDYYGAWRAMEKLYKEGRIRAIGVTSFWNERLADLANMNEVKPAVNQIETNVWDQKWSEDAFMKEIGIQHEAWAPFAEGNNDVFRTPLLQKIGEKYGKTVGQVMLRWLLQRDIAVIPKSVRKERMQENFDVFDFELTPADMEAIRTLDTGKSTIYDEMDPHVAMTIGQVKIHD